MSVDSFRHFLEPVGLLPSVLSSPTPGPHIAAPTHTRPPHDTRRPLSPSRAAAMKVRGWGGQGETGERRGFSPIRAQKSGRRTNIDPLPPDKSGTPASARPLCAHSHPLRHPKPGGSANWLASGGAGGIERRAPRPALGEPQPGGASTRPAAPRRVRALPCVSENPPPPGEGGPAARPPAARRAAKRQQAPGVGRVPDQGWGWGPAGRAGGRGGSA